jgi:hypothetical protein
MAALLSYLLLGQFLFMIPLIMIASWLKQRIFGNQIQSVKLTLGFALAFHILGAVAVLILVSGSRTGVGGIAMAPLIIGTFALIAGASALVTWVQSMWQSRAEHLQFLWLDLPAIVIGPTLTLVF